MNNDFQDKNCKLINDKEFALNMLKESKSNFFIALENGEIDKCLKAFEKNLSVLKHLSNELKNDIEFMCKVVTEYECYWAILYWGETFKRNEIIQATIKNEGIELRAKELLLTVIQKNSSLLQQVSDDIKSEKEFMLQAVKRNETSLQYASDELKKDKNFILQALEISKSSLLYASDELKNDKDFILRAIEKEKYFRNLPGKANTCLMYVSDELKNDRNFMLKIGMKNGEYFKYASDDLIRDKVFLQNVKQINNDIFIGEMILHFKYPSEDYILEQKMRD